MDFWPHIKNKTLRLSRALASASVIFYALPWLMVLLVLGTVLQKNMGLYDATQTYLNSIILWAGPVPLPGGLLTIGLIFTALTIKFLFYSKWNRAQAGIIISHFGVLLLLLGGLVTSATSKEGFMLIPEGQNVGYFSDYRERVVFFKGENGEETSLPFSELKTDTIIKPEGTNLTLKILMACDNCSARAPSGKYDKLQGLAQNMELFPIPSEKNAEANFSGMVLELMNGPDEKQLGTYIIMEDVPKNPIIMSKTGTTEIRLSRAMTPLPFSITLKDFRKIDYPGTQKARAYEADVIVRDNGVSWPVTISMNHPLRYKGYTFYQSSFEQGNDIEVTVLNVVQNAGRAFPYISSLVIFLGLLVHFIIRLQTRPRQKRGNT